MQGVQRDSILVYELLELRQRPVGKRVEFENSAMSVVAFHQQGFSPALTLFPTQTCEPGLRSL